jgi:hypothetical protein
MMPLHQWGPWTPDVTDYEGPGVHAISNVIPRGDGYGPFPSFSAYASALPGPCRGAFYALKFDGTVITFAGTATKLYQLNNTNFTWIDVSLGAGAYSALSSNANWTFAQAGNLVFATQANVLLQVFDLSASTAFSNALGSPPQAAYISAVGGFLVLSGLLSTPYRIQWCGLYSYNAPTSWTAGINSSDFQDFPDGGTVRGIAGSDQSGVIFQDQAIRRMSYVAGSPIIFQIDRIAKDKGLYAPYSIITAGERIFFFANQGFHKIEPGGIPEQIGRERVDRTFLQNLDNGNLQLFIGASDPRNSRVYWAYKSNSGVTGSFDTLLGYDYVLDRFFTISIGGQYLLGISQTGLTLENLDAIAPGDSIDAMTLSLDSYATAVQPQLAAFNSSNVLGFFTGPNMQGIIQGAEQGTDGQRITSRGFRPITDAATLYGSVSYRDTQAQTPIVNAEMGLSARTGRVDIRRDARYQRYQVRIPAATNWTFCAGYEPDVTTNGTQ